MDADDFDDDQGSSNQRISNVMKIYYLLYSHKFWLFLNEPLSMRSHVGNEHSVWIEFVQSELFDDESEKTKAGRRIGWEHAEC